MVNKRLQSGVWCDKFASLGFDIFPPAAVARTQPYGALWVKLQDYQSD
jgi:hypothetical protein